MAVGGFKKMPWTWSKSGKRMRRCLELALYWNNKGILTLLAQLGQSPLWVTDREKIQRYKRTNHSTVQYIGKSHTCSQTARQENHIQLHLQKPLRLTCFLHICSLNNKKLPRIACLQVNSNISYYHRVVICNFKNILNRNLYKIILLHKQYLHRIIQVNYTILKQQQHMLEFKSKLSLVVAQRPMYK